MAEISPDSLSERLERGDDLLVLDVRPADAFDEWHIPGSMNVDVYDVLQDDTAAAKQRLAELPDGAEVVTVCAAGVVSRTATELLRDMGYDASTLVDGMRGWSRVHRHAPVGADVEGSIVQVTRPGKGCLSHVLVSDGLAAVFDPSQYVGVYEDVLAAHDADLIGVFDTHAHADHLSGGRELADRHDVPYYLHPDDAEALDVAFLADDQRFEVGSVDVVARHTPGHSPGSVTFAVDDAALLTGDTLFHESVGRVELGVEAGVEASAVEANAVALYESLQHLKRQGGDPLVLPAHDPGSPTPPVAARLSEIVERNLDLGRSRAQFVDALSRDTPDHPPNFERVKRVNVGVADVPADERPELELGPNRCAAQP